MTPAEVGQVVRRVGDVVVGGGVERIGAPVSTRINVDALVLACWKYRRAASASRRAEANTWVSGRLTVTRCRIPKQMPDPNWHDVVCREESLSAMASGPRVATWRRLRHRLS